jgi:hypothetical protein
LYTFLFRSFTKQSTVRADCRAGSPFPEYCRPANPAFLDGVEVFNGNPRHDSRNHLAAAFAEENGLVVRIREAIITSCKTWGEAELFSTPRFSPNGIL